MQGRVNTQALYSVSLLLAFFLAGFAAALASAAAAFFSAVLAAPSPVDLATALVPNF